MHLYKIASFNHLDLLSHLIYVSVTFFVKLSASSTFFAFIL